MERSAHKVAHNLIIPKLTNMDADERTRMLGRLKGLYGTLEKGIDICGGIGLSAGVTLVGCGSYLGVNSVVEGRYEDAAFQAFYVGGGAIITKYLLATVDEFKKIEKL